jgi:SAF domain
MPSAPPFILLHPSDNILIAVKELGAGAVLLIDSQSVTLNMPIPIGHKIARTRLAKGAQIMRYGAPIGSLTQAVAAGDHVHLHNLKSDYIATHNRETVTESHND